jgi:hypothetical protein
MKTPRAPEDRSEALVFLWLRGLDLNQRALGYEPFLKRHESQRAANNESKTKSVRAT